MGGGRFAKGGGGGGGWKIKLKWKVEGASYLCFPFGAGDADQSV